MSKKSDEEVLTDYPKIELKTAGENTDGGYEQHYRSNIKYGDDISNKANDINMLNDSEFTEPFYKCPECHGPNLFKTIHESFFECSDCEKLVEFNEISKVRKKFKITVDENGNLKVKNNVRD